MVHFRLVVPEDRAKKTLDLLCEYEAVYNVVHLPRAAHKPAGDVILCDVAREDASVVLGDLKELDIPRDGSIAIEEIDSSVSDVAKRAEKAAEGAPSDAVIWEEVESRTSENTELSYTFLGFMVIAVLIAAVGILTDQPVLIIGAMVVGPEFGPLAGVSVAVVERRRDLAGRSILALAVGFPLAIAAGVLASFAFKWTGAGPDTFAHGDHPLTAFISDPDFFSVFVAALAGVAGVLSLTSAKSGALIGVLISVTTIPAAANIGVGVAYENWSEVSGATTQLAVNLAAIVLAGVATLYIQRLLYRGRRREHLANPARRRAGLPVGRSRRSRRSRA